MIGLRFIFHRMIWIFLLTQWLGDAHAAVPVNSFTIDDTQKNHPKELFVEYKNGLVNAELNDVPLGRIFDELKKEAGVQINLDGNPISNSLVSLILRDMPLQDSIQSLLKGYSYAIYSVENSLAVTVLSTGSQTFGTYHTVMCEPKGTGWAERLTDATGVVEPGKPAGSDSEKMLESLEDFRALAMEELRSDRAGEAQESVGSSDLLALQEEYEEALIERALSALSSEHVHLYEEALDQLVGIDDPRATEILVEAARTETDSTIRMQAVDALWRHAANLEFSDVMSIEALRQLAEDSDERVRGMASQALRDMDQYDEEALGE